MLRFEEDSYGKMLKKKIALADIERSTSHSGDSAHYSDLLKKCLSDHANHLSSNDQRGKDGYAQFETAVKQDLRRLRKNSQLKSYVR